MYKDNIYNTKKFNKNANNEIKHNNFTSQKEELILTSVEVIDDLLNNFFKNQVDKKIALLFYHNMRSKESCDKVFEIVLSKLNFIKLDFYKLKLYKSPFLFLLKIIIKNLPLISMDDKKILWDRIFLFLKSFNFEVDSNKNIPHDIVFSDIKYDDPIEFIQQEISEVLRIYNINHFINIFIDNLDSENYERVLEVYNLISSIFSNFVQFKFIGQLYKIDVVKNLNEKFPGSNDYTKIINFVLKNSYNYFISDELSNEY